jgi:hypothetical protein
VFDFSILAEEKIWVFNIDFCEKKVIIQSTTTNRGSSTGINSKSSS